MAEKYHILAIAPYEGMRGVLEQAAHGRDDIEMVIHVADLSSGAQLAEQLQGEGYDAIISRGGTAEMISQVATIPVVEIPVSAFDMLRVVQLTREFRGRMAVVGFTSITGCAQVLSNLLRYDVDVRAIHDSAELPAQLAQLRQEGYTLIVGDAVTTTLAQQEGMNVIMLTSGIESVNAALDQAVQVCRFSALERRRSAVLAGILKGSNLGVTVFADDGTIEYNNLPPEDATALEPLMRGAVKKVLENGTVRMAKKAGAHLQEIRGSRIGSGANHAAFYITRENDLQFPEGEGITLSNGADQPERYFTTFYDTSKAMTNLIHLAQKYSQALHPVFIEGEEGSGKDSMAISIHANSPLADIPLVTIDCDLMTPRRWNALVQSKNSIFTAGGLTLYFKSLNLLGEEQKRQLVEYIRGASLQKRHRLLFGYANTIGQTEDFLRRFITLELGALVLQIPPLRQRRDGIPEMAMLRISHLSAQYAKQIAGFTPQATEKLQSYDWPGNIDQFLRVLHELVLLTDGPFITEQDVDIALKKESGVRLGSIGEIDLNRTLDEITRDVILAVLRRENMNQTQAANKLGIGRSTLWRKLSQ